MAGVISTGNIGTEEPLPDERLIEMDEKIRVLKPDDTQYTVMTSRLSSRSIIREKANWLEEEDFPRTVTTSAAAVSGATSLSLVAGQGKVVLANDLLRNMRTGEGVRVSSVATDTLTIAPGIGSIPSAAVNAGDVYLVVADSQAQGSDFPTPRYLARILGYNYTQITRTPWSFTGTMTAIGLYGGKEPAKEAVRAARADKKKWENIGFFGMRSYAAAVAPENEPRGTAGGLVEFIQTFHQNVNGPITPDFFDAFIMGPMANGSQDKVLFAAPLVVASMSKWNRTGMGSQFEAPNGGTVHGVQIDAFISGAYGYRIPVVVKKEWSEFPSTNGGYGTYAFLVDMEYVQRLPLQGRDTRLLTDQQPIGKDVYSANYITEATYEVAQERAHGLLYGVTP